jgi:hypothetical protein
VEANRLSQNDRRDPFEESAVPISYEPPKPVAPFTSAAYGAAQQYNAAAPTIAAMRGQGLQAEIAGAQAYQSGVNANTQRSIAAGQQSTQLEGQHQAQLFHTRQAEFDRAQQQAMQQAALRHQAEVQARAAENEQRRMEQHFVQQVEAERLKLSFQEEMNLQHYTNGEAWVDRQVADGKIDGETATEMKAQIRKVAGPLEIRRVKSQALENEKQAKAMEAQIDLIMAKTQEQQEFAARGFPKTTGRMQLPEVRAEVEEEFAAEVRGIRATAGDAAAEAYIDKQVAKKGGHAEFYQSEPGKWAVVPKAKEPAAKASPKAEPFKVADAVRKAEIEADAAYPPRAGETGKPERSDENLMYKFKVLKRIEAEHEQKQPQGGGPPEPQPGDGGLTPEQVQQGLGVARKLMGVEPAPQPPREPAKPFTLSDPKTQTIGQRNTVDAYDRTAAELADRTDLPPDVKQAAAFQIEWAKRTLAARGSFENFTEEEKRKALQMRQWFAGIVKSPEARKPAAPAPTPAPAGNLQIGGDATGF